MRGTLTNSVAVDGHLVMPQAFDLKFGAPGIVEDVFVEEGAYVKAGTILAKLNNTSQQLDLKAANVALQQVLSNMYETIPAVQQTFNYPSFYPNASAALAAGWVKDELIAASSLISSGQYEAAASELNLAVADLETISSIFRDAIENPRVGLGDTSMFDQRDDSTSWMRNYPDDKVSMVQAWQEVIDNIGAAKNDLQRIIDPLLNGTDSEAKISRIDLEELGTHIERRIIDQVNRIRTIPVTAYEKSGTGFQILQYDPTYPPRDLCLHFYNAAQENLDRTLALIEEGQGSSKEFEDSLRRSRHYMEICNSILGSSILVLEHGYSLANGQQYNFNLSKAAITLENRKDDLLKTVIIAPFDGTVGKCGRKEE